MTDTIFTIGHSTHSVEEILQLLKRHSVTAVCDVRSSPYSHFNPQFNREPLKEQLLLAGIVYVFLGKELGARTSDRSCYVDGKVQYDLLAKTPLFNNGLTRLKEGNQTHRIAIMCAEKDPLQCHRTILVSRYLTDDGIQVLHIQADGKLETHDEAINRLLKQLRLPEVDMFLSKEEIITEAYRLQGDAIAYLDEEDSRTD